MQFFKSKQTTISDENLVADFKQSGNTEFLGELFKRYSHLVFGVCMKYLKNEDEAQDMTMIVFEKLLSDLNNHEVQHFKAWLYMVTKNQCLMLLRKAKTYRMVELNLNKTDEDGEVVENDHVAHLDDAAVKEIQFVHLEAGIQLLNGEQKQCVELFFLQDKSYVEITEITGYNLNQVKSYIQNGKRNLKIYLEKKNVE